MLLNNAMFIFQFGGGAEQLPFIVEQPPETPSDDQACVTIDDQNNVTIDFSGPLNGTLDPKTLQISFHGLRYPSTATAFAAYSFTGYIIPANQVDPLNLSPPVLMAGTYTVTFAHLQPSTPGKPTIGPPLYVATQALGAWVMNVVPGVVCPD